MYNLRKDIELYYYRAYITLPIYHPNASKLLTCYMNIVLSFLSLQAIIEIRTYVCKKLPIQAILPDATTKRL